MENDSSETLEGTAFENKFQATFFSNCFILYYFLKKKNNIHLFTFFKLSCFLKNKLKPITIIPRTTKKHVYDGKKLRS